MSILLYIVMHALAAYLLLYMIVLILNGLIWFPALFLGMWFTPLFIASRTWRPLHDAFPVKHDRKRKRYFMVNATLGKCSFVLNATVGESGLTLVAVPMYRPFHPPIHVPWSEIEVSFPYARVTILTFRRHDLPDLRLFRRLEIDRKDTQQSVGAATSDPAPSADSEAAQR